MFVTNLVDVSDVSRKLGIVLTRPVFFLSLIPTPEAKDLRPRQRLPTRRTSSSGNQRFKFLTA